MIFSVSVGTLTLQWTKQTVIGCFMSVKRPFGTPWPVKAAIGDQTFCHQSEALVMWDVHRRDNIHWKKSLLNLHNSNEYFDSMWLNWETLTLLDFFISSVIWVCIFKNYTWVENQTHNRSELHQTHYHCSILTRVFQLFKLNTIVSSTNTLV